MSSALSLLLLLLVFSDWQKVRLQRSEDPGRASGGDVFVHSENGSRMLSNHGWTQTEGDKLCADLNLGGYKNHTASAGSSDVWEKSFNCTGVKEPKSIWDCERDNRPNGTQGVYLQCEGNTNHLLHSHIQKATIYLN